MKLEKAQKSKLLLPSLHGSANSLAIAELSEQQHGPLLVITENVLQATQLTRELTFFTSQPLHFFADWETLPYDTFSPHQDIISDRLIFLHQALQAKNGIFICAITSMMQRLPPTNFIIANTWQLKKGEALEIETLRSNLIKSAYRHVTQVMEHGEFTIRGSIIDVFPMGSREPYRIELFDNEVESLRHFDPETQRSAGQLEAINLLPAKEFPLTEESIALFRQQWREKFTSNPNHCAIYQDISSGLISAGIEYYLPLFFSETASMLDYFSDKTTILRLNQIHAKAKQHWSMIEYRYEQLAHDITQPILAPQQLFIPENDLFEQANHYSQIIMSEETDNSSTHSLPSLSVDHKAENPITKLCEFINGQTAPILLCAESLGRREALISLLQKQKIPYQLCSNWQDFKKSPTHQINISIAPVYAGFIHLKENFILITENELFGERTIQQRSRKKAEIQTESVIRSLAELHIGGPIVHIEHGVGRYLGLETIKVDNITDEYLVLSYANNNKLFVPVSSLHLISRYTGADSDHAPLHSLGSDQWEKLKEKAAKRVRDVAAELLEIYAEREAARAYAFTLNEQDYQRFSDSFPFELTTDQSQAIGQVIEDMCRNKPMDRLVCGDVGFGKTEVAMRAAYVAAQGAKQAIVLVPTTLLAQQHYDNFKDRFADWPFHIEVISRFRSPKEQKLILEKFQQGKIDILIGTHRLLQPDVIPHDLGLIIVDEEHRFGVSHKEKLKKFRATVDTLTLTATPIPRTLNMSLSGMRDLSLIATPPAKRLAIKTFLAEAKDQLIKEAINRELMRGGQVYFLHNDVSTIEKVAQDLTSMIPEARVVVGHGQLREKQLEQVMVDFYHRRFNILVCTTIIESGIDVPTANTIIIQRADKFGLAQLHQLRGRVGRSHHQAYAYLLAPPAKVLSADARKRLDAFVALEDLGIGFTLATHDLEIRGAGELLGAEQSGHIEEIGFTLYMEMLEKAVKHLKSGKQTGPEALSYYDVEINLHCSAIIPDTYLPDPHARLILYKRMANCQNDAALDELKIEMIDRFGLLPEETSNLFAINKLKQTLIKLGVKKLHITAENGFIEFNQQANIDPKKIILLLQQGLAQAPAKTQTFRMEGSSKLRFKCEAKTTAERLLVAEKLIAYLCN